ncbi:riboflavin kinase [Ramicandelaber brevisporus]|nr:riboflavin kinase [Ramicandelaber brevisporus]
MSNEAQKQFPVFVTGTVVHGFGRGSKQLGFPTANIDEKAVNDVFKAETAGVYFGWAQLLRKDSGAEPKQAEEVVPFVMSLGWNPYYQNERRTMEVHILRKYEEDFYGEQLKVAIVGHIRDERNFDSLDALIAAINADIDYARVELAKPELEAYKKHAFFTATPSPSSLSLSSPLSS